MVITNNEFRAMIDIGIEHIYQMADEGKTVEDLKRLIDEANN